MSLFGKMMWVQLVVLAAVLSAAHSNQNVPRHRRQGEAWWRSYPQSMLGSAQGSSRMFPEVSGQSRMFPVVVSSQSRQLSSQSPISVQCEEDSMVVSVQRDLYGIGKLIKPSDLTLGPKRCTPRSQSTGTTVIFQNGLQDCGNTLQMTPDWLIYSTNLTYSPTPALNSPIIRTNSAVVSILCYYPRHGNVSSNAIKPTWYPFSSTVSMEERLSFSLQLMADDWSSPRTSSIFQLGDVFHIEASIATGNHVPLILFVQSCVATISPDVTSSPSYAIIDQNGCLLDGKQQDSSSAYISPRAQPDKLRFTVDAFRFTGTDVSTIYITCNLRAALATQNPDPMNKACSFSKSSNSWFPVEGTSDICRCCDTRNCVGSAGQSRRVGPNYPGSRWSGKRDTASHVKLEHGAATLGPLLVIGPDANKALAVTQETEPLKLWVLVTIGSISLVVLLVCIAVIGKLIFKKFLPAS
ncbi:zona pellucida sperm-binding protein 3-like [Discoglossus pictus]